MEDQSHRYRPIPCEIFAPTSAILTWVLQEAMHYLDLLMLFASVWEGEAMFRERKPCRDS